MAELSILIGSAGKSMTDKELRRLKRQALLELLLEKTEENEKLAAELEQAKQKLSQRDIAVANAGTLAEAAASINGMLSAADETAKQYLENIRNTEERCRVMTENAKAEAEQIVKDAEAKAEEILKNAEKTAAVKTETPRSFDPELSKNLLSGFDKAFEQMKKRNK